MRLNLKKRRTRRKKKEGEGGGGEGEGEIEEVAAAYFSWAGLYLNGKALALHVEGSGFAPQNHRNNPKPNADPVGMLYMGENVKLSTDWHPWQLAGLPTAKFMALSLKDLWMFQNNAQNRQEPLEFRDGSGQ